MLQEETLLLIIYSHPRGGGEGVGEWDSRGIRWVQHLLSSSPFLPCSPLYPSVPALRLLTLPFLNTSLSPPLPPPLPLPSLPDLCTVRSLAGTRVLSHGVRPRREDGSLGGELAAVIPGRGLDR